MWIRALLALAVLAGLPLLALSFCQSRPATGGGPATLRLLLDAPSDLEVLIDDAPVERWTTDTGGRIAEVQRRRRARVVVRHGGTVLLKATQTLTPARTYVLYLGGPWLWQSVIHYSEDAVPTHFDPSVADAVVRLDGIRREVVRTLWPGDAIPELEYGVAIWSEPRVVSLDALVLLPHQPTPRDMPGTRGATAADVTILRRMTAEQTEQVRASLGPPVGADAPDKIK